MDIRRVILVTGAASGIGAATCRRLAGPGIAVIVSARSNAEGAARVAAEIEAREGVAMVHLGDLVDPVIPGALVDAAVARFGRLDVIVSNAGFADRTPMADLADAAFTLSMDTIGLAFLRLARAAMPYLRTGQDARIVAVSSFVAHAFRTDMPAFAASAAAKAALEALVRALSLELAVRGVTVNAVVPGYIRKDPGAQAALAPAALQAQLARIPLGRLGTPDDVAEAIAFLVSPQAGYITGHLLHVNGGLV